MKKIGFISVLMTAMSFNAHAEIEWSGFATVAGGIGMGDDIFIDSDLPDAPGVDGYYDQFEFKPGTFFALQASSDLGEGLSATVQIMSRGSNDWDPEFTWAYMSYDVTDNFRILAGRQRMPHYMFSDYLDVSYAYHWITPPAEVYGAPFDSIDGISAIYTHDMGNSSLTFQAAFGQDKADTNELNFEDVIGGTVTYNYDWLTIRLANFEFEVVSDFLNGSITSQDLAVQADYSGWFAIAEYSPVDLTDTGFWKIQPWMVSVGKSFDTLTPHVTYGHYKTTSVDAFFIPVDDRPYYTIGLRWDFHDSAALKFEYSAEEDSAGNEAQSFQIALTTVF